METLREYIRKFFPPNTRRWEYENYMDIIETVEAAGIGVPTIEELTGDLSRLYEKYAISSLQADAWWVNEIRFEKVRSRCVKDFDEGLGDHSVDPVAGEVSECPKCRKKAFLISFAKTRGGDEALTEFGRCNACQFMYTRNN